MSKDADFATLKLKLCPKSANEIGQAAISKSFEINDILPPPMSNAKSLNYDQVADNSIKNFDQTPVLKKEKSVFEKFTYKIGYNEILITDAKFREFYAESLYEAIFTFPKF